DHSRARPLPCPLHIPLPIYLRRSLAGEQFVDEREFGVLAAELRAECKLELSVGRHGFTELEQLSFESGVGAGGEGCGAEAEFLEDRKSTRLNSSHVKISYAV